MDGVPKSHPVPPNPFPQPFHRSTTQWSEKSRHKITSQSRPQIERIIWHLLEPTLRNSSLFSVPLSTGLHGLCGMGRRRGWEEILSSTKIRGKLVSHQRSRCWPHLPATSIPNSLAENPHNPLSCSPAPFPATLARLAPQSTVSQAGIKSRHRVGRKLNTSSSIPGVCYLPIPNGHKTAVIKRRSGDGPPRRWEGDLASRLTLLATIAPWPPGPHSLVERRCSPLDATSLPASIYPTHPNHQKPPLSR